MRQIIVFCVFAVAAAAPSASPAFKPFTHTEKKLHIYNNDNKETLDEIVLKVQIEHKNGLSDSRRTESQGELGEHIKEILISYSWPSIDKGDKSFSWVGPDGVKYTIKYVIDESEDQPSQKLTEDQTSPPQEEEEEPPGSGSIPLQCLASLCG